MSKYGSWFSPEIRGSSSGMHGNYKRMHQGLPFMVDLSAQQSKCSQRPYLLVNCDFMIWLINAITIEGSRVDTLH